MNLLGARDAIAKHYENVLDNVSVMPFGGPITREDIEKFGQRSPCILVTCLGVPRIFREATIVSGDVVFGVFCIVEDSKKANRDAGALLLVEAVMSELLSERWNGAACGAPQDQVGTNLYSTELDECGVSLWAVRWRQQIEFKRNTLAVLDDFNTLFATYEVGPTDTPVTEDEVDLT